MASLATFAPTTIAVKGLGGSSLAGTKLNLRPSRKSFRPTSCRSGIVVATYGDKSVYFDLEDLGNTTGTRTPYLYSWPVSTSGEKESPFFPLIPVKNILGKQYKSISNSISKISPK